jgi:hypothetical protein
VTWAWLEGASRIKRRITTNGGEDKALVDNFIDFLHDRPHFVTEAQALDSRWAESARCSVEARVMFSGKQVEIYWSVDEGSYPRFEDDRMDRLVMKELPAFLQSLVEKPQGSWLHELSEMVPEVQEMLNKKSILHNEPVIVLELDLDHYLWRRICVIKGQ